MITIRTCQENELPIIARLIADTYRDFNLTFAPPAERDQLLGTFRHAYDGDDAQKEALARRMRSEILLVALDAVEIVGVVRGEKEKLHSLFVRGDHHRQGIGRRLVEAFEEECMRRGYSVIRLTATLFAEPFYLSMGYKRSTGVRPWRAYGGEGMFVQPMKKVLPGRG
jgi:GNAT superfamily N-acetyltransferase